MHKILQKNQILTIPNLLSLVRLLLIPVIMWLYLGAGNNALAIAVIILSGLTDVADGLIARRFHMISDFGKILDPIADKLTQGALILCLTATYAWMKWLIILFALKEFAMGIMGCLAIRREDSVNSSQWHGKLNTAVLYGTMCLLILFPAMPLAAANALIAICAMTILMSFVLYTGFYIRLFQNRNEGPSCAGK